LNRYGKRSHLHLDFASADGHTFLRDVSFTAPFKVMKPFVTKRIPVLFAEPSALPGTESTKGRSVQKDNEATCLQVMVLSVSAGLMAGDDQHIELTVGTGVHAQVTSQAADKVHAMAAETRATRQTDVVLAHNASLAYTPLPVIPFADSAFVATTTFDLEDRTARLFYSDVIAAGRVAHGERFAFREYRNRVTVHQEGRLLYADNAVFLPHDTNIEGLTLFEGYTHMGTALLVNAELSTEQLQCIEELCTSFEGLAGITSTERGALCIKTLSNGSEPILDLHRDLLGAA
jgi:urease accessory protein